MRGGQKKQKKKKDKLNEYPDIENGIVKLAVILLLRYYTRRQVVRKKCKTKRLN